MQDFVWWSAGLRVSLFRLGGEFFSHMKLNKKCPEDARISMGLIGNDRTFW